MSDQATPFTAAELLQSASGFAPDAKPLLRAGDLVMPKRFTHDFTSPGWPEYDGPVVIRYPSLGDMLRIERIAMGGDTYAELAATLNVCVEKAPPAWYRLPEGSLEPVLALDQFQDSEGLLLLWRSFLVWRRTFRR